MALLIAALVASAGACQADIFQAAAQGDAAAVQRLLEQGADAAAPDREGATPLHHAAAGGRVAVVALLLAHHAPADARKRNGVTPLHIAASLGFREIAEALLQAGAATDAVDDMGRTPLSLARDNGRQEVVALLEEWRAKAPLPTPDAPPAEGALTPALPAPFGAGAGEVLLQGVVRTIQAPLGRMVVDVAGLAPAGAALAPLPRSAPATVLVGLSGRGPRVCASTGRPMPLGRLRAGDRVWLLAQADGPEAPRLMGLRAIASAEPEPPSGPAPARATPDPDGVSHAHVVVPMVLPVTGRVSWSDTFLQARSGGARRHLGQDLIAPKMRPLVAAFDGVVYPNRGGTHNTLRLQGDNGFSASYMHINNDTPGTDDGQGSAGFAFAAGIEPGVHVSAGQLLGWVGDSGNAENTCSHLHFELYDRDAGGVLNAAPSLRKAQHLSGPRACLPAAGLLPAPGEVRLDGILREARAAPGTWMVDAVAETDSRGRVRVATKPERWQVAFDAQPALRALGMEEWSLPPESLVPGRRVAAFGRASGRRLAARVTRVEMMGLQAGPGVLAALAAP